MDSGSNTESVLNEAIKSTSTAIDKLNQFELSERLRAKDRVSTDDEIEQVKQFLNHILAKLNNANKNLICRDYVLAIAGHINKISTLLDKEDHSTDFADDVRSHIELSIPYLSGITLNDELDATSYYSRTNKALADIENEALRIKDVSDAKLAAVLNSMAEKEKEADALLSILSRKAIAGSFSEASRSERSFGLWWIAFTVSILLAWAFMNYRTFTLSMPDGEQIELSALIAKTFLLNTPFMLLTAFSVLQVVTHQRMERQCKKTAIDLITLGPYLKDLPEESHIEIKSALAHRLFGPIKSENEKIPSSILELLHKVIASKGQGKTE